MLKPLLQPNRASSPSAEDDAGNSSPAGGGRKVYSVSELNMRARTLLESELGVVWLEGEVSNFKAAASGHWYLSLKDDRAQISAAMFKNKNRLLKQLPKDGDQVLVKARVSLYEPRGDYQIILDYLEPAGAGLLQLQFNQLKEKLEAEGLFNPEAKKPLPVLPRKIGVITSPSGAAIKDVLSVLKRRMPGVEVLIYPVAVQGKQSAPELFRAIQLANQRKDCDVLLLTRGGGSMEDLWSFNNERVARAIVASELPIVSAVGHEIDFTIADFTADLRAPTPSAAAEILVPDRQEMSQRLNATHSRLVSQIKSLWQRHSDRLQTLSARIVHPRHQLELLNQRLDQQRARLGQAIDRNISDKQEHIAAKLARLREQAPQKQLFAGRLTLAKHHEQLNQLIKRQFEAHRQRLTQAAQGLHLVSPLATLGRGYSITKDAKTGGTLDSVEQFEQGQEIVTQVSDGEVRSEVKAIEKGSNSNETSD